MKKPELAAAKQADQKNEKPSATRPEVPEHEKFHPLLQLQDHFGNRAMSRLIQAKLALGPARDKHEQEADRIAHQVTNMPAPVQRQEELDEEKLQMKPIVQRAVEGGFEVNNAFEGHLNRTKDGGAPLPDTLRTDFEPKFGADFSGVKVHTDAQSDQLNQSLQAKAFTMGRNVFFRQGAYQPESQSGRELIAHELTHVVQQTQGVRQAPRLQLSRTGKEATAEMEAAFAEPEDAGEVTAAATAASGSAEFAMETASAASAGAERSEEPTKKNMKWLHDELWLFGKSVKSNPKKFEDCEDIKIDMITDEIERKVFLKIISFIGDDWDSLKIHDGAKITLVMVNKNHVLKLYHKASNIYKREQEAYQLLLDCGANMDLFVKVFEWNDDGCWAEAEKLESNEVSGDHDAAAQSIIDHLSECGLKITDIEEGDNIGMIGDRYVVFDVKSVNRK